MKRVQAIVTGRKKQCTKLPTPAAQKGGKTKSASSPESPTSGDSQAVSGKTTPSGAGRTGKLPPTPPDSTPPASLSSASSTITAGSSSSISTLSASSSVRGGTKIPASTPKKGSKDGSSSTSPSKGRVRLDSEGKSKSKQKSEQSTSILRRSSSKEKQRGEPKGKKSDKSGSKEKAVVKKEQSVSSSDDQSGFAAEDKLTGQNRDAAMKAQASANTAAATASQQHGEDMREKQDASHQGSIQADPRPQTDPRLTSAEQLHHQDGQRSGHHPQVQAHPHVHLAQGHSSMQQGHGHQPVQQGQGHPPIHGILKGTGHGGSAYHSGSYYPGAIDHHYNGANVLQQENPYSRNGRPPSRSHSARGSSDLVYQQGYGSLPRSSRSTTPTQENIYSYGSLPRRSNPSTPTQQNPLYYNGQGWGSLARRAESDSGFPVGSTMDRSYINNTYGVVGNPASNYGIAGYSNKHYGVVNPNYQPPRPGSVPPPGSDSPDSLYSVARPGSVPPHYYSDTETAAYHQRVARAGSVPLGYESESGVYRHGRVARNYESESDYGGGSSSNLRVHPGDEQYRAGPGKRPIPRRHTVGAPANKGNGRDSETERKREAFMQLLAQRYPQYADKIAGTGSSASSSPTPQSQPVEKPARARDVQRRRTAVVTYDPGQAGQTLEYDDLGTMSDLELPSFQRGGFMRTSLPIVRSASTSLERPLGLVFLVYGDQTKKSLLPNEITTLDTVRALFVRAFPNLTLEMLESPRNKIYLLDPATNIYFQLEDLGEIKDRSVLKIHETDSNEPQKVKERQEVRGRTVQMPASRSRQGYGELPVGHGETFTKAHSLPPQAAHNYSELMQDQRGQWEMERRSRSRTPEPAERPRSLSAGATSRQRFSHSPDRLPTPERGPLNPIPENRQLPPGYRDQGNYYESVAPANYRGPSPYPSGIYEAPAGYPGYPPASTVPAQQTYVARSTRAAPLAHPQRAVAPGADMRQGVPSDAGYTRSQGYRVPPGDGPGGDTTRNRIEKMEQQLANLTAWVHYQKSDGTRRDSTPPPRSLGSTTSESSDTFPASSASKHKGETPTISTIATTTNNVVQTQGLSDIPDGLSHTQRSSGLSSRESTPLSAQAEASFKVAQLRSDLHVLRRQHQLNMEAMRDEFMAVFTKVKKVLSSVPGAENQVNFHKRTEATVAKNTYLGEKQQADKELSDLEASVEELRTDVISRQCRVNANDVEGMALLLSNITKSLADIKARFPAVNSQMMEVLEAERKVIENEEKFLKDEPGEIENSLKRCKKLTGTLYTLKRLASVQDHRPPSVPSMPPTSLGSPLPEQKTALLENIRAVVPDHDHRVQQMEVGPHEAADASRERKKKISSQQEALKFGKSLEMATKNLRPSSTSGSDDGNKDGRKNSDGYSGGQVKPAVPAKPILSSSSSPLHTSPTATSSSSTVTAANVASVKPSFSAALTTAKSSSDKPTATVSAMTAGVADTVTTTVTRMTEKESGQSGIKGFPNSSTQTSGNLTNTVHGGTGTVTQTVKVGTHSPKKKDASIYTYQVCGPVSPVFPLPPDVFTDNGVSNGTSSSKEMEGKSKSDLTKKGSVSFSNPPVTGSVDASSPVNGHSDSKAGTEKVDLATQKQNARSAFFSSLNSPPTSPSSKRDSACLDPGPVVSPGLVGKVTPGPTINLVLSGTASPKSPTSPGSFNISPPEELKSPPAESKTTATSSSSSAPLPSPTRGIPRFVPESKSSSFDSHSSPSSQTDAGGGKQKKVPPPPPPRKGSRPTSACISPVNGGTQDPTAQETPKFVGGILGQHRLSGGPLSSTPKPASQQKPVTQFEKDLASGVYANMNRPDVQNQKSSPQQMISEANAPGTSSPYRSKESSQSSSQEEGPPIPPPPSVTIALDREERGSSSESTSSSSGTSMGSQQSVIHVARSASVIEKGTGKPKPEPPRRQSSLLSKFTGSRDSKNKMNNGKAKVNGVDL